MFFILFMDSSLGFAQGSTGWTQPVDITGQPASDWRGFGVAVCDGYQNLHLFWADNKDQNSAIFYRNDIHDSWSDPIDVLLSSPSIYWLDAAVSNKHNSLHVVWADRQGSATLYYSHAPLADAGDARTWTPAKALDQGIFNPTIKVDPAGVVHIIYAASDSSQENYDIIHIYSTDDGNTWSRPNSIYTMPFAQPSYVRVIMAIDDASRIHLGITSRSNQYGAFSEVGYMRSPDGGKTWDSYKKIADQYNALTFQGVDIIAPFTFGMDEVHLTWHDPRRMELTSTDGGATWSNPHVIMELGAAFGGENYLAKDSAGNLYAVVAWSQNVYSLSYTGGQWGQLEEIDNRPLDPHGQQLVVCQGNKLNVFYYDNNESRTIWYSSKTVNAPHIPRQPIPGGAALSVPTGVAADQATEQPFIPTVTPVPTLPAVDLPSTGRPSQSLSSPLSPILFSIIPVLIVIFAAVWISRRQS